VNEGILEQVFQNQIAAARSGRTLTAGIGPQETLCYEYSDNSFLASSKLKKASRMLSIRIYHQLRQQKNPGSGEADRGRLKHKECNLI